MHLLLPLGEMANANQFCQSLNTQIVPHFRASSSPNPFIIFAPTLRLLTLADRLTDWRQPHWMPPIVNFADILLFKNIFVFWLLPPTYEGNLFIFHIHPPKSNRGFSLFSSSKPFLAFPFFITYTAAGGGGWGICHFLPLLFLSFPIKWIAP